MKLKHGIPTVLVFLSSLLLVQCSSKVTTHVCDCKTSETVGHEFFPITSIANEIILCKQGTMNGMDWTAFLKDNVLNDHFKIYDFQSEKFLKTKFPAVSLTYKDQHLIAFSHLQLNAYDCVNETWVSPLEMNFYKEKIYAQNGKIHTSTPEFIFTPPKLTAKAIADVNAKFEEKLKNPNNMDSSSLVEYLFLAAVNGDQKSVERLRNFQKLMPITYDVDPNVAPANLDLMLEILKDFETHKRTHEVEYLDLKIYPMFENRDVCP